VKGEAALFKALSEPLRLRLAALLAIRGEMCVCVLGKALGEPDFKISRALGVLRRAGVVEARREGTWMHYRLAEPRTRLEECLQDCFRDCLADHRDVKADLARSAKACRAGARPQPKRQEEK
jgi:ArsR family transcriptional regulator